MADICLLDSLEEAMALEVRSRIYYLTPAETPDTRTLVALVRRVLTAGVGMVQYRAKGLSTRRMVQDAEALLALTRPARVPLLINDRLDVALAVGADGAHVGAEDLPVPLARRLLGPYALLGATVKTPGEARQAERDGASYLGCGPLFPSPTKPEASVVGPEGVAAIQRTVSLPICVIGGLTRENLPELRDLRPELVAVVSAVNDAPDPGRAAAELVAAARELWG